jgi:CubicO group peptidase (beta-lactamase class C family)
MIRSLASLGVLAALLQSPAAPADPWARVADLHSRRVRDVGIVGSSLLFMQNGRVAHRATVGFQDLARRTPVDASTIYHWASITKTMTGVAILQLRDRRRLSLDDPAVAYVPELRAIHNPFGDVSQVTVRTLMAHTSGLRASTWPWGGDKPWHPFEPTQWAQFAAMLPYTDLRFQPGTQYSYSNPGVIILGRIIELLTGDDYEVYVTKNILMPLGMTRSFFDRAPYHLLPHRSHSYVGTDAGTTEQPFDFDSGITVSNGGLNAPLDDMARYLAFLSTGDGPVLARASLDEMFTPQIRAVDGEGGSGAEVHAGLSSFIERHGGVQVVGHSGDQNGFVSHLYVHRPTRSGYLIAFNTHVSSARDPRRSTRAVDDDVRDAIVGAYWSPPR